MATLNEDLGDYGAAQPLVDYKNKAIRMYNRLSQPLSPRRQDTSYYDDQVRKATASFAPKAVPSAGAGGTAAVKRAQKRTPPRPSGKRR